MDWECFLQREAESAARTAHRLARLVSRAEAAKALRVMGGMPSGEWRAWIERRVVALEDLCLGRRRKLLKQWRQDGLLLAVLAAERMMQASRLAEAWLAEGRELELGLPRDLPAGGIALAALGSATRGGDWQSPCWAADGTWLPSGPDHSEVSGPAQ